MFRKLPYCPICDVPIVEELRWSKSGQSAWVMLCCRCERQFVYKSNVEQNRVSMKNTTKKLCKWFATVSAVILILHYLIYLDWFMLVLVAFVLLVASICIIPLITSNVKTYKNEESK